MDPTSFTAEVTAKALTKAATPKVRLKALQTSRERGQLLPRDPWTPEEEALLGEFSDKEIAELLERPVDPIKRHCSQLGIGSAQITAAVLKANTDLIAIVPAALQKKRLKLNLIQHSADHLVGGKSNLYRKIKNFLRCLEK